MKKRPLSLDLFGVSSKADSDGRTAGACVQALGLDYLEGAYLMQTNDRVVTRRQALGVAVKALAVVVPVAAVLASSAKSAQAAPTEWRRRWRRRWW
jgi:hypothetical protein